MPAHDTYILHIYRSRAISGWQWAARLEKLPDRASRRFTNPEALLAHLRTVLQAGAPSEPSADTPAGDDPHGHGCSRGGALPDGAGPNEPASHEKE
jgi:hypothetical protein